MPATDQPTVTAPTPPTDDRLHELGAELGVPVLDDLDGLVALLEEGQLHVRHSKGPEVDRGRQSIDYESGLELPGISCHPLDPPPWWTRPVEDWLSRQVCSYDQLAEEPGRFAWVLRGNVSGTGPDNEPLLEPWEPVGILTNALLLQAKRRYEERFDRSKDSRG
jgi:hypothetical protein